MTTTDSPPSGSHDRLWLLAQNSESDSSNLLLPITMAGPLNISALEAALADVIERHHSLRTGIYDQAGHPVSFLHSGAAASPRLSVMKITSAAVVAIVQSLQHRFSLAEEIPIRAQLLAHAPMQHTLYLVAHPMAFDHWSVRPLFFDLMRAYGSRCKGRAPCWPSPAPQYCDYVSWQRSRIGEECDPSSPAARQLAFWIRMLHNAPKINFPPPRNTATGLTDGIPVRLNPEIHRRLLLLGATSQASLLMVLHAAILLALSGLTASPDTLIATLVSRRKSGLFRDFVGSLTNVINIRTDVRRIESFRLLLARVREAYIAAYGNSDLEYGRVVEACRTGSDLKGGTARVMVTVRKESRHVFRMNVAGSRVETNSLVPFMFGCDLAFEFVEWSGAAGGPQGIEGRVRYNPSRVDRAFVSSLLTEFLEILKTLLKLPGRAGGEHGLFHGDSMPVHAPVHVSSPHSPPLAPASPLPSPHRRSDIVKSSYIPAADPYRVYTRAKDPTQDRLVEIWEEILSLQRIGSWDHFFDLGGDEILFAKMMARVSAIYGENFSIRCKEHCVTVAGLAAQLIQRVPLASTIKIQAGDPHNNLPFWFLHGDFNGRGLYCRELSTFLDKRQPFYVLPPHGLNGRSVPGSIGEMASDYIKSICKVQPNGPFCLGGFCVGGLVALETAVQLEKAGEHVAAVILVDTQFNAGLRQDRQKRMEESEAMGAKSPKVRSTPKLSLSMHVEDAFGRYSKAGESYYPAHYLGKVFLLCPSETLYPAYDPASCWFDVIKDLTVRWIKGGHFTALSRNIGSLGGTLADCLASACKSSK